MRALSLVLLATVACGTDPNTGDDQPTWEYPQVPEETQRTGDPAKGYDYLVNGGYITCGIPKSIFDQVMGGGPGADTIPGRTGDNAQLPYYYSAATSQEGVRVVSANCLACHAGRLRGEIVVGLGGHDRDFTTEPSGQARAVVGLASGQEKVEAQRFADRLTAIAPFAKLVTVGVNPADNFTAALMAHRDPQTLAWSDTPIVPLPPTAMAPVDVPPWWRMKKKHAMFYSASGRGDHARIMMTAALLCTENVAEAQAIDNAFVDVRAWIESLEAPKWPFAVDMALATQGKTIYDATCKRCHGTPELYPNQVVPLAAVGTDALLASGTAQFAGPFVQWFANSFWGQMSRLEPQGGYLAPPLDGIWASAPYFHNGSVPDLALVLDSTKRPKYWTRTFDSNDYDQATLGWKFTALDHGQAGEPNAAKKKLIYDTTIVGYGNGGHDFGDGLEPAERLALLEYLKTL